MPIHTLTVGPMQENCYLLEENGQCVIVDPGEEAARIVSTLAHLNLQPMAIWLTHAHFDHVGAVGDLVETIGLPVYLHQEALEGYLGAPQSAARWGIVLAPLPEPAGFMVEGQKLVMGYEVLYLPGHAPGHLGFYRAQSNELVSGDVLFREGIGRYDLPGSNLELLKQSLRKVTQLPPTTRVYPGHGPVTTIEYELQHNPYLNQL
jgi:hydroxyacylglutathione hydrolase